LVPVLTSFASDEVAAVLLLVGLAFLAASWGAVGAYAPYEPKPAGILPLEVCGMGCIAVDSLYLNSTNSTVQVRSRFLFSS
jgi:hypothetical protein